MERGALALPTQQAAQGPQTSNIQCPPQLQHRRERASGSIDGSRNVSRHGRPLSPARGVARRASIPAQRQGHDSSNSSVLDLAVQGQRAQLHQRVGRNSNERGPVRHYHYQQQYHEQQQSCSPSAAVLFHQAEQDQLLAAYVAHMQAVGSPHSARAASPCLQQHMQYVSHTGNSGGCTHFQLGSNAIDWNGMLSRHGSGTSPGRLTDLMGLLPQPKFEKPRPEGPAVDTPSSMATGSARSNNSPGARPSDFASPTATAVTAAAAAAGAPYGSPGLAAALAVSSYACQQHFSSYWNNAVLSPAASEPQTATRPAAASGDQKISSSAAAAAPAAAASASLPGAPPPIRTQGGPHRARLHSEAAQLAGAVASAQIRSSSASSGGSVVPANQQQQQWDGTVAPFWLGMPLAAGGGSSAANQADWSSHQQQEWHQQGLVAGQHSPAQSQQHMQHSDIMLQQPQQWPYGSSPRHGSSGGGQQGSWSPGHTQHPYHHQQQHYPSRLAAMTHGTLPLRQHLSAVQEHDGRTPGTAGKGAEAPYRRSKSYAGSYAAVQRRSSGGGAATAAAAAAAAAAQRHNSTGGAAAPAAAVKASTSTSGAHKGARGSSRVGAAGRFTSGGGAAAETAGRCSQPSSATAAIVGRCNQRGGTSNSGWVHAKRQYSSNRSSSSGGGCCTPTGYASRHCNSSTVQADASTAASGAVQRMQPRSSSGGGIGAWQDAHVSVIAASCTHMQQESQQLWSGQQQQPLQQQLVRPTAGPKVQHIVQQLQQLHVKSNAPGQPRLHTAAQCKAAHMPSGAKHSNVTSEFAAQAGAAAAPAAYSSRKGRNSSSGNGAPAIVGKTADSGSSKLNEGFFLDVEQASCLPTGGTCQPHASAPKRRAAVSPSNCGPGVSERLKWWEQQQQEQQVLAVSGLRARGPGYSRHIRKGGGSSGHNSNGSRHTPTSAVASKVNNAALFAVLAAGGLRATASSGSSSTRCQNSSAECPKVSTAVLQVGQELNTSGNKFVAGKRQPGRPAVAPAIAGSPGVRGQRWSAQEYLASATPSRIPSAPLGPHTVAQLPSAPGTPSVSQGTGPFVGLMLPPIRTTCTQRPEVGTSVASAAAAPVTASAKQQLSGSFNTSGPVIPATPQPCDAVGLGPTTAHAGQCASHSPIRPSPTLTRSSASGSSTASSGKWSGGGSKAPRSTSSLGGRQAGRAAFASNSSIYSNISSNGSKLGGRQQPDRPEKQWLGGGSATRNRACTLDRRPITGH